MKKQLSANSSSLTLFAQVMASALAFYTANAALAADNVTEFADGREIVMTEGQTVSKDLVGGQLNVNGTINAESNTGYLSKFYFDGTPSTQADPTLTTKVTVGAGAVVKGELIGGSYIRTSGASQQMAVASTAVTVDGGTVSENVFGGGKTNTWGGGISIVQM